MKAFKFIIFILLILIIGSCIYVAVQPNTFEVVKTQTIEAPAAVIYDEVIDYKNWESWSSWIEKNPDTKITYPEQTKGVGGHYSWEDDDGIGNMKTVAATPYSSIEQTMQFSDFEPTKVTWDFKPTDDGKTNVTWSMKSDKVPFVLKFYAAISGGFDKMMGPDLERGLEKLDSLVVESTKKFDITVNGITEYGGGFYLYKTSNANNKNISSVMAQQFGSISSYMSQYSIGFNGMPLTVYQTMNMEDGTVIMSNGIPVSEKIDTSDSNDILCGYITKTKALKVTLKGNYTNLNQAWKTAMTYIAENNLVPSDEKPFEIYTNDPGEFPNPADWITEIYIPIVDEEQ